MTGFSNFTGFSGHTGLWDGHTGLWSGAGGFSDAPIDIEGGPYLILDFVGGNVPYGSTLDLNFTGQTYTAFTADPSAQGFPNFWAWS
jgi:hypothetical protein